jgi:UDP-glucose 4-epimerase
MNNILIIGGSGFIGTNLSKFLTSKKYNIKVLDKNDCIYDFDGKSQIEYIKKDIRNFDDINESFKNIEIVFHLAAEGSVIESINNPLLNLDVNVKGTLNILNACITNNVSHLIFSSTGGALMGDTKPPVDETSLPAPISPYGASKLACEGYLRAYSSIYNLKVTIARFANIYGKYSIHKNGVINKFFNNIINNQPVTIFGNGNSSRDFLYVEDLVDGLLSPISKQKNIFEIYNFSSEIPVRINELATIIYNILKRKPNITFEMHRKGEVFENYALCAKAKKDLSFDPRTPLEEGLNKTLDWYTKNN